VALVVGSQCDNLNELGFVTGLATRLHTALVGAGWRAPGGGAGLVIDPCTADLKDAVRGAFAAADAQTATLLISFLGHGMSDGDQDFYLMTTDADPGDVSETAMDFTVFLRAQLKKHSGVDGLVVLVDACEAQEAMVGAAQRWTGVQSQNRGRMELLVASGTGAAYNGCFTRTILDTFERGRAIAGDRLLCADLHPVISARCDAQAQHLSYAGGAVSSADPGLWLVPNLARRGDAVAGRPAAGLVDQLTAQLLITDGMRVTLAAVVDAGAARLRLVAGAAGSGKSTLLALLVRPSAAAQWGVDLGVAEDYVKAAVFLDTDSTVDSLAEEMAAQLSRTLAGFADQAAAVAAALTEEERSSLDRWQVAVVRPLARCRTPGLKVNLIVDGIDQPDTGSRQLILTALNELTADGALDHVRVIAGLRIGDTDPVPAELGAAHRIPVCVPDPVEITRAVRAAHPDLPPHGLPEAGPGGAGGWLQARLLTELAHLQVAPAALDVEALITARAEAALPGGGRDRLVAPALSVMLAVGVGPVLPIRLLAAALGEPGRPVPIPQVRDTVAHLGALLSRGHPGLDTETLGIAHQSVLDTLTGTPPPSDQGSRSAHQALIDGYGSLGDAAGHDVVAYWTRSAPRHYLEVGDSHAAVEFLASQNTVRAADNRDRWASWLPAVTVALGAEHPDTLATRHNLAFCRGRAGDVAGAAAEFEALMAVQQRVLGAEHPDALRTRHNLAFCRGEAGDVAGAAAEFEALLAVQQRVLGAEHPDALTTRYNLAFLRVRAGDVAGAAAEFEALLTVRQRVLGAEHPDALRTRYNLAFLRGRAGDAAGAAAEFEALLPVLERVLGAEHPDTLTTRYNLASRRGEAGDAAGAAAEFEALLAVQQRVLGAEHPDTLTTRHELAFLRGRAGDVAGAAAEFEALLTVRQRVLGAEHPDTLTTRHELAFLRGRAGDVAGAAADFEALLPVQQRVLGAEHPDTLTTRYNLAFLRVRVGDVAGAAAEFEALLPVQQRVLGAEHPDTLTTRHNLAFLRVRAGDVAGAAAEFEALLAVLERVLGAEHPDTLRTRNNLASRRGEAGDVAGAAAEFEALLPVLERVLGAEHPDTLRTRNNLASRRGRVGDAAGAAAEFEALLPVLERVLGAEHPDTLTTRYNLAFLRVRVGDAAGAAAEFEALLPVLERVLGAEHPDTLRTRNNLAFCRGEAGDAAG
jgi:tetratricopeptide (TPR) repeat protein